MSNAVVVVGAGIFGITAALALRSRGYGVTLIEAGTVPNPLAASTDISKVIRMEYGLDTEYMALAERAQDGWRTWNDRWTADGAADLYHETGVLMLCREPMEPGGFEYESFEALRRSGHTPERLDPASIKQRFPAWSAAFVDGFFHARGGYAESGRVVSLLAERARASGVVIREHTAARSLATRGHRVEGVVLHDGQIVRGDAVIAACGAWSGALLGLARDLVVTGQPVFHLRPAEPKRFHPKVFPTFTADITQTGYYGFPLHRDGVLKIANHGVGRSVEPDAPRDVTPTDHERLRAFLLESIPSLAEAEVVSARLCLYTDALDGDFWIARDPERDGLAIATGGSGHAFKFAPVLGDLIADAVEGIPNPGLARFRWRPGDPDVRRREAARHRGDA